MRMNRTWSAALMAALLLGSALSVAAQDKTKVPGSSADSRTMFQVLPGTKQIITGTDRQQVQIAREVRHELAMLPYYSIFDNLTYRVDGSTVTLGGATISVGLRHDAEAVVKKIEGVNKVVNKIEELPPLPDDDRIRRQVARRIFNFGGLSQYAWEAATTIHIIVNGGHVSLEGYVNNQADRDAAGLMAHQVDGVFSVKNNLEIVSR